MERISVRLCVCSLGFSTCMHIIAVHFTIVCWSRLDEQLLRKVERCRHWHWSPSTWTLYSFKKNTLCFDSNLILFVSLAHQRRTLSDCCIATSLLPFTPLSFILLSTQLLYLPSQTCLHTHRSSLVQRLCNTTAPGPRLHCSGYFIFKQTKVGPASV